MATRTGKLIMATKIKLDRGYKNVLSYSETEMVSLLTTNAVGTFTNCSFVRPDENVITIEMTYGNAIKCNYLGFQNPDYSNKWFFAFIDEIEYVSDKAVNVHFTIDEYATWYDYWSPEPCYVEREHANTDVAGDNLVPEQLELGDYVANGDKTKVGFNQGSWIISGKDLYCFTSIFAPYDANTAILGTNVCGIPISGGLFVCDTWQDMAICMQAYSAHSQMETVTSAFMVPYDMIPLTDTSVMESHIVTTGSFVGQCHKFLDYNVPFVKDTVISAPTKLDNYTPVNQKLLTAPFMCLILSNNAGSSNPLAYEYFADRTQCQIESVGIPTIGCSIFTFPIDYKGTTDGFLEGVSGGKFPTLSWSGDAYTNWLTQNSVNMGLGVIGDIGKMAGGAALLASGNPLGGALVAGGAGGLASQGYELYQHSLVPQVSMGNINVGDVITAMRSNVTFVQPMSIRADMAERIDKYFTRFGYRVNKNKLPNQFGRQYWNYVKIGAGEDIGITSPTGSFSQIASVPPDSMEAINNIYRNGVTIWHDHANMGNFALSNPIVTP